MRCCLEATSRGNDFATDIAALDELKRAAQALA